MNSAENYEKCKLHPDLREFKPLKKEIVSGDLMNPESIDRRVFHATNTYSELETANLTCFNEYYRENYQSIPNWWTQADTLKFLHSTDFNIAKTAQTVAEQIAWRDSMFPIAFEGTVKEIINTGMIYSTGFDSSFRPIVVFSYSVYYENVNKHGIDAVLKALCFFFDFIVECCGFRGKVEQVTMIADMSKFGVTSIDKNLKLVGGTFEKRFLKRMNKAFLVNLPMFSRVVVSGAMKMANESTRSKIVVVSGKENMFEFINESQVEKKFKGKRENIQGEYFPPSYSGDEVYTEKRTRSLVLRESSGLAKHDFEYFYFLFMRSKKVSKFYAEYRQDKKEFLDK